MPSGHNLRNFGPLLFELSEVFFSIGCFSFLNEGDSQRRDKSEIADRETWTSRCGAMAG